jgi:microcystin-dependent protein
MTQPYLGEMRIFSFNFPPRGWALCNGQLMAIQQNQALFSILGTTYGGNGTSTFALPNLQGCAPIHRSNAYPLGSYSGEENHTLTQQEMPTHNHGAVAATGASAQNVYAPYNGSSMVTLAPLTLTMAGGNQPHPNQQPYLVINTCIALQGIYPSRN